MSKKATTKKTKPPVLMHAINGGLPADLIPAWPLSTTELEHFYEIARDLHKHNLLKSIDRFQITSAATTLDKMINAKAALDIAGDTQTYDSGAKAPSAEHTVYKSYQEQWLKCVAQLGLSPSARTKITGKKEAGKPELTAPKFGIER